MVGPGLSYFMINHDKVIFSEGDPIPAADEKFWGITFIARIGMGFHFDDTTGMMAEIGIRLGELTNVDNDSLKSPHDGYSVRAGFRFIFE